MDLETLRFHLLYDFESEHELIQAIELLSQNFTKTRENINDYLKDPKLVSAYAAFYLLTNIAKLEAVLDKVKIDVSELSDYEIFDIGSGPGTFSLALLSKDKELDLTLIETSDVMREQAKKLLTGLFPASTFSIENSSNSVKAKGDKKRLGIFGHSSNEMGKDKTLSYIKKLDLDLVLFIEPGTKDFFNQMLVQREELLKNYEINYPCLSASHCPMDESDWCHQFLRVTHSHDVERLCQLVKKDRRNLPIIVHLYEKKNSKNNYFNARIVRVYRPTKFSVEWQICMDGTDGNKLYDFQLLLRGMKKNRIKELQEINSGEGINIRITKELGDGKIRGELI